MDAAQNSQARQDRQAPQDRIKADIVVVGAGASGLIAAIALARHGHSVALIGKTPPPLPGRTVALFDGSRSLLDGLGLSAALKPISAPVDGMRIIDDTNSFFRPPPALFDAREIGLESFGVNVPNDDIVAALAKAADALPGITHYATFATAYHFGPLHVVVTLEDGREISCALVVAGDGRNSLARQQAGIAIEEWSYPQMAMTMILRHRRPHDNITTEYHTRSGPFTFVPMPALEHAPHRSSLVWLMSPKEALRRKKMSKAALAEEIAEQAQHRFGAIEIEGDIGQFPMSGMRAKALGAPRLMLVGEACHVFPPLAAQGLNLGIRDSADAAAALVGVNMKDAKALAGAIAAYNSSRRADIDIRTKLVDVLNRSLLTSLLPVDFLRGAGMAAVSTIGPLRRALLREGVTPALARNLRGALPALFRRR